MLSLLNRVKRQLESNIFESVYSSNLLNTSLLKIVFINPRLPIIPNTHIPILSSKIVIRDGLTAKMNIVVRTIEQETKVVPAIEFNLFFEIFLYHLRLVLGLRCGKTLE